MMLRKIIGIIMIAVFFVALISYCIYMTGSFWRGMGTFFLSLLMTAFVVVAVYLTFSDEKDY